MNTEILEELFGAHSVSEEDGGFSVLFRTVGSGNQKILRRAFLSPMHSPESNIGAIQEALRLLDEELSEWEDAYKQLSQEEE